MLEEYRDLAATIMLASSASSLGLEINRLLGVWELFDGCNGA